MSSLERYNKIKKRTEQAQKKAAEAEGALTQIMKRLKDEFDCDSIEAAEKLLKRKQRATKKLSDELETELANIEDELEKLDDD